LFSEWLLVPAILLTTAATIIASQAVVSGADERGNYLLGQANALYRLGDPRGDNAALRSAIEVFRDTLEEWTREHVPLQWAMTQTRAPLLLRADPVVGGHVANPIEGMVLGLDQEGAGSTRLRHVA